MKAARILLSACALGLSASAFAVDYPEERGVVPSVVPPAPDESGTVNNIPAWRSSPEALAGAQEPQPLASDRSVDSYFLRYDANRDGAITWDEAQQDPDLVAVFDRADANGDRILSRSEFQDAAVIAVNERGRVPGS